MKSGIRRQYSLAVSGGYLVVGVIIVIRSIVSDVVPLILLGLVFAALGAVRIREYLLWKRTIGDS
jgi:hypothetical protein